MLPQIPSLKPSSCFIPEVAGATGLCVFPCTWLQPPVLPNENVSKYSREAGFPWLRCTDEPLHCSSSDASMSSVGHDGGQPKQKINDRHCFCLHERYILCGPEMEMPRPLVNMTSFIDSRVILWNAQFLAWSLLHVHSVVCKNGYGWEVVIPECSP